jgi:hypothetical protein
MRHHPAVRRLPFREPLTAPRYPHLRPPVLRHAIVTTEVLRRARLRRFVCCGAQGNLEMASN